MTKQELAHIAKVMYDLQEYCSYEWDESEDIPCVEFICRWPWHSQAVGNNKS